MAERRFKIVYGVGVALTAIIRGPYWWRARANRIVVDRKTAQERSLLALLRIGMGALPLVSAVTPWLKFAEFKQRSWAGWTGAASFAAGLWLLWRAHADLDRNWSDSLRLRQGHRLVTTGVYRRIRHPMYAAGWLLGIGQALLVPNWIAGPSGLVSFALLYVVRVPGEEGLLSDRFGDDYRAYMARTGRVIPRFRNEATEEGNGNDAGRTARPPSSSSRTGRGTPTPARRGRASATPGTICPRGDGRPPRDR